MSSSAANDSSSEQIPPTSYKDRHNNATHQEGKHAPVYEISATGSFPLHQISGIRMISKDKKRTYLDKKSFDKWFDYKQFEEVAKRSKFKMSDGIPAIDNITSVFPVIEEVKYTHLADHKTILEFIDEVCHVLKNNMKFTDVKKRKHYPFYLLDSIHRIFANEHGQIVIKFKDQKKIRADGKKSKKAIRREREGKISIENRPKDEVILGIHPGPAEKSVCFGKCSPDIHCEYITIQLKCLLLQATAIFIRDKVTHEMGSPKFTDLPYPPIELKRCDDYPWAKDETRFFYNKIYKVNVMPLLFLVYKAKKWIIANHYLLCQERIDSTSWHLFADYDPLIESDPAVKWFNSNRTCTLDNFFNVMRYLCRLDKKRRILSTDGTIREYRLTPDHVLEPTPTQ